MTKVGEEKDKERCLSELIDFTQRSLAGILPSERALIVFNPGGKTFDREELQYFQQYYAENTDGTRSVTIYIPLTQAETDPSLPDSWGLVFSNDEEMAVKGLEEFLITCKIIFEG
jgi:hypothetical protein